MSERSERNKHRRFNFSNKYENRIISDYEMVDAAVSENCDGTNPFKRETSAGDYRSVDNMHKFAREGEAEKLSLMIRQNLRRAKKCVSYFDKDKMTPLHYAARFNHLECVKIIVEQASANINIPNEEKVTPIHFAARYRRKARKLEVNKRKFQLGKTIEGRKPTLADIMSSPSFDDIQMRLTEEEKTPSNKNSVILYLVSKGANPNIQDIYGCTPLHYAAIRGNEVATEQLLMVPGINAEIEDNELMTPLHLACAHNHFEIVKLLLNKSTTLFNQEETGCIPFHIACGGGNVQLVILLIGLAEEQNQLDKMLNAQNRDYETPLHYGIKNGHIEIAQICLEKGANVNSVTLDGKTALHLACNYGSVELVQLLISFEADLNVINKTMQTPLHSAVEKNHVEVVEYLIEKDVDIESKDIDSRTPLLVAAFHGHYETIRTLINYHCKMNATEKSNKNSLYLAVERGFSDAVKTILNDESGKKLLHIPDFQGNYPLHIACRYGYEKIVTILLDAGAIDDVKNEEERTPMHLAAKYGRTSIVKILGEISKRTLINDEDGDSNTPLHLAARCGYPKVIQLLLNCGADINARNCNKYSALDFAAAEGNLKAAQVLLQNGAQVNSMDKAKVTPLYLACKNGHDNLVSLLLRYNADISTRVVGDINDPATGCNALDAAIDNGHRHCALAILKTDKWEIALRNQTKSLKGYVDTPMRKLIRKMPDVAEAVFKKCKVSNDKHPDHIDYSLTYNFEFLEDSYASWGIDEYVEKRKEKKDVENEDESENASTGFESVKDTYDESGRLTKTAKLYCSDKKMVMNNHPLMVMVRKRREDLLEHHIVSQLLQIKWNTFGMAVYYSNLAIYLFYLLSLLTYMIETEPPFKYYLKDKTMGLNVSTCGKVKELFVNEKIKRSSIICKYFVIMLTMIELLKEAIQLFINGVHYFSMENLLEWIMYILSFLTVIDVSACQSEIGIREAWQWQTGAVSSLLGIMNLVLFIRKVPFFGIFVVMFTDVLVTFIKFLPLFILFNFAFAFAFYILLSNQLTFYTLFNSIIQTFVMTVGELEFDRIFNSQWEPSPSDDKLIFYDGVTYTVFGIFILMMNIITMNLLVGLAVDDIKAVQEKATLERMGMKVTLALEVEGLIPEFFRRRYIIKKLKFYPNRQFSILKSVFGTDSMTRPVDCKDEHLDDLEQLKVQQIATVEKFREMKQNLKNINSQSQIVTKMLSKVMKNLKIEFDDEDITEDKEDL